MNPANSIYAAGADAPLHKSPAVAWSAIIAGAIAAVIFSLILFILGTGLGFSMHSSEPMSDHTMAELGIATVSWLIFVQWLSSGVGGYFAGRLRSKPMAIHDDEIYFRDTAHGFLAWCIATLVIGAVATSTLSAGMKAGAYGFDMHGAGPDHHMGPPPAGMPMAAPEPMAYYVDALFRSDKSGTNPVDPETRAEASRILMHDAMDKGDIATDKIYLTQLVSSRTGLAQADADKRVNDVFVQIDEMKDKMHQKMEEARKTASKLAIFTALSLLIGAFIASVCGALGGYRRDEYHRAYHKI